MTLENICISVVCFTDCQQTTSAINMYILISITALTVTCNSSQNHCHSHSRHHDPGLHENQIHPTSPRQVGVSGSSHHSSNAVSFCLQEYIPHLSLAHFPPALHPLNHYLPPHFLPRITVAFIPG